MSKSVNSSFKIPDWFDLKKYEVASNLPLVDWALNLILRGKILHWTSTDYFKHKAETTEDLEKGIALIQSLGLLSRTNLEGQYELAKYDYDIEKLKPGFGVVYSLPLDRAVQIYQWIKWDVELRHKLELVKYQEIYHHKRTAPLHEGEENLKNWYENYYERAIFDELYDDFGSFSPHVCVDLGVPDEMLIGAFKNWLKSIRQDRDREGSQMPEKLSSKLTNRWVDSAILPYLDLKIYENIEGITFPLHVIGDAIFPSSVEFDTTEAVRKTTRRNAEKALEQAHGILRHALIEEELKSNGKKSI